MDDIQNQPSTGQPLTEPPIIPSNPVEGSVSQPVTPLPQVLPLQPQSSETVEPYQNPPSVQPLPPAPTFTPPVIPLQPTSKENTDSHPKTILYFIVILIMVGAIVVLTIIILNLSKQPQSNSTNQPVPTQTSEINIPKPMESTQAVDENDNQSIINQSTSDEVADIEKDLANTDFTKIDKDITDINSQLNQ